MAEVVLVGWVYSLLIAWLAKLRRDHEHERETRRDRQRRQRVGRERGACADLKANEQLLLSILRERQSKGAR